jgi:response regulator RpfG family c-di-GMP phosphodiesterase
VSSQKSKALDLLHRAQVLDRAQYERAAPLLASSPERSEDVLVDAEILTEAVLLKALSGVYRTQFVSSEKLSKADIPRATIQLIPRRVAETLGVFPVVFDRKTGVLSVVTPDPDDADIVREVKLVSGAREVKAFVARPAAVAAAIRKHHAGDARAFARFERSASYEYGQQVLMPDGRIKPPSVRRSVSLPEDLPGERQSPLPSMARRSIADAYHDDGARPSSLSAPPTPARDSTQPVGRRQTYAESAKLPVASPASDRPSHELHDETTLELLSVMVSLLENARQELRGHSAQVARLLRRVAERMNLDRASTYAVVAAGLIHDLGKMGQFHLTALNCSEYEGHRTAAQKAFETPLRLLEAVRLPMGIKNAVFHMYERFDGKGFPDKLVGKDIPLGARLLAAADTYADLTHNPRNPFRRVLGPAEAIEALTKHKGTIFDPAILDLFRALVLGEDVKAKLLANRFRAMIVEPDPEESTVLELRMFEQGFDVTTARSAEAARRIIDGGAELDLMVCELDLPDVDGLDFLAEARQGWGRDLPWVVHTRRQGRSEAQRAFDLGAIDFVAKPVQTDVLVAKIKAMLEQRAHSGKGGSAKGVSGSLREMGLPDIVQVLFHGRKTGKLVVKSGASAGEIHFQEGAIINAALGTLVGVDAFYALVRFQEGEFAFDPSFVPGRRLITDSPESLLLEGMRRMDEGI